MAIFFSRGVEPLIWYVSVYNNRGSSDILRVRNPGDFSGESLNVVLFTLQDILRYEQRE